MRFIDGARTRWRNAVSFLLPPPIESRDLCPVLPMPEDTSIYAIAMKDAAWIAETAYDLDAGDSLTQVLAGGYIASVIRGRIRKCP